MRDGFVYMGFRPPVIWIKESDLKYYRTADDVIFHMLNVGDQYIEMRDTLYLITITQRNEHMLHYKSEKVIIVKGQ